MRRLVASTYGLRQAQDTKTAYAVHENALTGFTKESRNIGDLTPLVFVYVRVPRRWLSCRGHLTQTEGRVGAETAGEGRPSRAIPISQRNLLATFKPRHLRAGSSGEAARQMRSVSWSRASACTYTPIYAQLANAGNIPYLCINRSLPPGMHKSINPY